MKKTPATLADIIPDRGYPLAVYCHFVGVCDKTARQRMDAGEIPERPRNGPWRMVSGATILAHCGHAEPPAAAETKAQRERRTRDNLQAAEDAVQRLGRNKRLASAWPAAARKQETK